MKKQFLLILLMALSTISVAQTVNLHMKNGETIKYNSSDVDFVDFSEDGQQASSDKYGISGGVRVNYGKKIHSIFNYMRGDEYVATYDSLERLAKIEIIGKQNFEWVFNYSNNTIKLADNSHEVTLFSFELNADGCISKLFRPVVDSLNNVISSYGYEYKYTDDYLTKIKHFDDGVHDDYFPTFFNSEYWPETFVYNSGDIFKMTFHHNNYDYVKRFTTDNSINKGNFYVPFNGKGEQICFMSAIRHFNSQNGDYCIDTILFNSGMFGKVSKNMVTKMTETGPTLRTPSTYRYDYSYDSNGYINSMNCNIINNAGEMKAVMDLDVTYK